MVIFVAAIAVLVVPTSFARVEKRAPMPRRRRPHLSERAALLTLIMCGEAFVKVALVVSSGALSGADIVAIVVEFVVVFAVFWTYFDDVPPPGIRRGHASSVSCGCSPTCRCRSASSAIAIGMSKFLQVTDGHVHDEVVAILGDVGWAAVYMGLALIGCVRGTATDRPVAGAAGGDGDRRGVGSPWPTGTWSGSTANLLLWGCWRR